MDTASALDAAILLWLVATWFWEGHHRRCAIELTCPSCRAKREVGCDADRRVDGRRSPE